MLGANITGVSPLGVVVRQDLTRVCVGVEQLARLSIVITHVTIEGVEFDSFDLQVIGNYSGVYW